MHQHWKPAMKPFLGLLNKLSWCQLQIDRIHFNCQCWELCFRIWRKAVRHRLLKTYAFFIFVHRTSPNLVKEDLGRMQKAELQSFRIAPLLKFRGPKAPCPHSQRAPSSHKLWPENTQEMAAKLRLTVFCYGSWTAKLQGCQTTFKLERSGLYLTQKLVFVTVIFGK